MKDAGLGNAREPDFRESVEGENSRRPWAVTCSSGANRVKRRGAKGSGRSCDGVFLPLAAEEKKQLEELFPALLALEAHLESEIVPGRPSDCQSGPSVQLQGSCQLSSLFLRRRLAPVIV